MPTKINAQSRVGEAVCQYWLNQIRLIGKKIAVLQEQNNKSGSVQSADPEVLKHLSDTIHELRVAVRRCQSIALSFAPYLPDQWPDRINTTFRPLRRRCNHIRDLDVFLDWLEGQLVPHPAVADLLNILRSEQWRAYLNLTTALSDKGFLGDVMRIEDRLIQSESINTCCQNPAGKSRIYQNYRIQDVAAAVLMSRAAAITSFHGVLPNTIEQESAAVVLHRLRVAVKDFRYTLELLKTTLTEDSELLHEQFRQFQDSLGEIHDRIRFSELLEEFAHQKRWPEDLTADLQTELSRQKLVLWQKFSEQWPIMTPKWFAKAVLSAIMHNNSE